MTPPGSLWGGSASPARNKQSVDPGMGWGLLSYSSAILDKSWVFSEPQFPLLLSGNGVVTFILVSVGVT